MKTNKILSALMLILLTVFLVQCERYGKRIVLEDEDSDQPTWAGKDGGDNPHKNDDSGTARGDDYGDLYELCRDINGVPDLMQFIGGEWYVSPADANGDPIILNEEGELDNPELATGVEFGRLNIVRSPDNVLVQAFNEAMKVLQVENNPEGNEILDITLDFCGRLTSTYRNTDGELIVKTIDSPRENMAIYKEIMQNKFNDKLAFLNGFLFEPLEVAASCFAAGSDKTGTVNVDEVVYINGFMECIGINPLPCDDGKQYFNFTEHMFTYDRSLVYGERYVQFLVWDGLVYPAVNADGTPGGEIMSILEVMDTDISTHYTAPFDSDITYEFTNTKAELDDAILAGETAIVFAMAVDDAVQVLEFIHEDSNIQFLPGYTPED